MDKNKIAYSVGLATFFLGFGGPAVINLYLLSIQSPLVLQFRSTLSYISAIFGDGIILPVVNMIAVSFLLRHKKLVNMFRVVWALVFGVIITAYFHVVQAAQGLVNWSMPKPWQWNFLGVWHGLYMLLVSSLVCFFYIALINAFKKGKNPIKEAAFISFCILVFFVLLKIDYASF